MFSYQDYVRTDWVDYNGHMNDSAYAKVFSIAVDRFMDFIGLDEDGRSNLSYTIFTLETHLCYLQEAHQDEQINVSVQILDTDSKRAHVFFEMKNDNGTLLATSEQMLMGMDTQQVRPAPFPGQVATEIKKIWDEHKQLETPKQVGRRIGIKK
ncbi:acyl-CoA thioester hydrolase [Virgibacillus subterraneus]|uniref:Acyl-CoA thioester hydrolase n=2 Tax=Virgibacillus TaxID=84406 RepID=A0A1H1ENG9_9BACI|nr:MULTISPECIES: thioesterase family protein [Virgibacillus]SDQ90118.1 acyl-CoA thioester hydrolase [Virgibacillus salinus]SEQ46286.1 acyl-CoA thioester hydrolase [Virgibacillus subterraneus]